MTFSPRTIVPRHCAAVGKDFPERTGTIEAVHNQEEYGLSEVATNEPTEDKAHKAQVSESELNTYLETAERAARAAGDLLLEKRGQVAVEYKEGFNDLVTAADREAEAVVIETLRDAFPAHRIIGEESGELAGADACRWLVDPLDGTTNYAQGLPLFGTSIGLEKDGELLVGVIHLPALEQTYSAVKGAGATCNGEPVRVSSAARLQQSLIVGGYAHNLDDEERRRNVQLMSDLMSDTRGVRMLGSAAINLAYVAAGKIEAYWAPSNEVWDVAAGILLVREAGGAVTDLNGGDIDLFRPRLLATNGRVHEAMLQAVGTPD